MTHLQFFICLNTIVASLMALVHIINLKYARPWWDCHEVLIVLAFVNLSAFGIRLAVIWSR